MKRLLLSFFVLTAVSFAQTGSNGFSVSTISSGGNFDIHCYKSLGPYNLDNDEYGEFIAVFHDGLRIFEATSNDNYILRSTFDFVENANIGNFSGGVTFGDVDNDGNKEIVYVYGKVSPTAGYIRILEVNTSTFVISEHTNSPISGSSNVSGYPLKVEYL